MRTSGLHCTEGCVSICTVLFTGSNGEGMRWEGQRESGNVEDRRGMGPARIGGLGLGGIILVLVVSYFTGVNPLTLINMLNGVQSMPESSAPSEPAPTGTPNDKLGKFASVVLADTETTWKQLLGPRYEDPRLVLFTGAVRSACGTTSSAVGPFYCPVDHKVYLGACRTSRIIKSQKTDAVLLHIGIMTRVPQQAGESV